MVEYFTVYFPKSDRKVKIQVSGPRLKSDIEFDTLYFLDGQNAFKDSHAAFGRSIRATKALNFAAKEFNKRIIGVAIYNMGTDIGRINEYTPFKIENDINDKWGSENLEICHNFCYDVINTLIPFIESKYNVKKDMNHRFIYGSSLAAVTALYLGFNYKDSFKVIGAFSTASFLFEQDFYNFLSNNKDKNKDVFVYVEGMYLNSAKKLYKYFKENDNRVRLIIDVNGLHNEETWGNHMLDFINFIYFDDIEYKK